MASPRHYNTTLFSSAAGAAAPADSTHTQFAPSSSSASSDTVSYSTKRKIQQHIGLFDVEQLMGILDRLRVGDDIEISHKKIKIPLPADHLKHYLEELKHLPHLECNITETGKAIIINIATAPRFTTQSSVGSFMTFLNKILPDAEALEPNMPGNVTPESEQVPMGPGM